MSTNVPAIRYETFIEAFEKAVHAIQLKVRQIEAGQMEYIIATEAVAAAKLPNEGEVKLAEHGATIQITALPTDCATTFYALAADIAKRLHERGMRRHQVPFPATKSQYYPSLDYAFNTARKDSTSGTIYMWVRLPPEGITDMRVDIEDRVSTEQFYHVVPRDEPMAPGMKTAEVPAY